MSTDKFDKIRNRANNIDRIRKKSDAAMKEADAAYDLTVSVQAEVRDLEKRVAHLAQRLANLHGMPVADLLDPKSQKRRGW